MKARGMLPNWAVYETAEGHKMAVQHDLTATTAKKRTEQHRTNQGVVHFHLLVVLVVTPVSALSFVPIVELLQEQTVYE